MPQLIENWANIVDDIIVHEPIKQSRLARDLGVDVRTVVRWRKGENPPSADAAERLRRRYARLTRPPGAGYQIVPQPEERTVAEPPEHGIQPESEVAVRRIDVEAMRKEQRAGFKRMVEKLDALIALLSVKPKTAEEPSPRENARTGD